MRAGSREHGSHVAMLTPRTPLHLGRPSRVQRYSSSMHKAMEEDSLMTRYDDDVINLHRPVAYFNIKILVQPSQHYIAYIGTAQPTLHSLYWYSPANITKHILVQLSQHYIAYIGIVQPILHNIY